MPVSLHTHSWYSLLEGVSSPRALLDRAARLGCKALALTDTNNLYGAVTFVEEAFQRDVRPLLGTRLRLGRQRCVALIAERSGYRSLCRILSRLHLEGEDPVSRDAERSAAERGLPPLDGDPPRSAALRSASRLTEERCSNSPDLVDLLRDSSEGLHVLVEDISLAEALREPLGRRLWIEVVCPLPSSNPARHEQELLDCARRLGIKAVASTAAHLATPEEYPTFRLVTAIRQRTLLERLPATLPLTAEHHLVSPEELQRRFHDLPELVRNTDCLAELLRSDVLPRDLILPEPILPHNRAGKHVSLAEMAEYLHRLCERGLRQRDLGTSIEARRRLREELAIIDAAQLPGYFLTVRDIARHARRRGHSMALRGSAGNSLVCYLLGITDVDPLRFNLPLERFLHPGRTDLPDIDLDFDWKVRDAVIAHVVKRHGQAHTAQISMHLFFQPRSAFREAGRVHGLSDEQISNLLTTLNRSVDDLLLPAEGAMATGEPPSASFPLERERWPLLLADARRLLGHPHHLSIHPGGVVITPGPISDHVPLERAAKGVIITQFDKDAIERIGLVKIDLLGNRGLSTVDEARRLAGLGRSLALPAEDGDPATLDLLRRGDTLGVTQLESPAMRHLLIQMRPNSLDDVIRSLALLRPGAAGIGMKESYIRRRHGLEPVRLIHPRLTALLEDNHGLMIYEDDTLCLVQALTGLSAADADRFRKRISRHKTEEDEKLLRAEFLALCRRREVPAEAVTELWLQLAKFNRYSFCKSHAVSYGLIAWSACWLKAHFPLEFWTAALNNTQGAYPRRVYIEAIKRAGLEMRPPCVNRSDLTFTVEDRAIRVGLGAIAGLPLDVQDHLIAERCRGGPYRGLADFRCRLAPGPEALALLIRAGALDGWGRSRPALFLEADLSPEQWQQAGELFPEEGLSHWSPADYSEERRLQDQWQLLGFILGRPLFSFLCSPTPDRRPGPPLIESRQVPVHRGRLVRVRGLVSTGRHTFTQDGRPLQFLSLEDDHGLVEVSLFPGTCEQVPYLTIGPYEATGIVEEQYGIFTLTARSLELLRREGPASG